MDKIFYITTPIYYANSLPHLGHLYTTTVADVVAKHRKQRGFDTYFLTGTDEHGVNIQRVAEAKGQTPQDYVDYISGEMRKMFADFGLTDYDVFMRTTAPFHYEAVRNLWTTIAGNQTPKGNSTIYKDFYEGWFCPNCAEFKTEGEFLPDYSEGYFQQLKWLKSFLIEGYIFDNYLKIILLEKIVALENRESKIDFTKEQIIGLQNLFPTKKSEIYDINRDFNKNSILKILEILEQVKIHYLTTEKVDLAEKLEGLINIVKDLKELHYFSTKLCLIHEKPLDLVKEESYFFRLSDYDEFLLSEIEANPHLIRPEARKNEVLSFLKTGLQDLSISREKKSVSWGVPVPGDENHVMYVWLDALSNYITAIGYGNEERKGVGFEKYWENATHLVGKDILRQHSVYWFSFLHAAGLNLPQTVFAHGMWLDADGRKMGKTLGNAIELEVLQKHFQTEAVRYFVLREMVFGQDGRFGYENLIDRTTADLASGLGNLSSRTLSMINKYRDGVIPSGKIAEHHYIYARRAGINPDEQELVSALEHARDEFVRKFDDYEFSQALESVWLVIARIDKMISDAKPWELIKDENQTETLNAVLYRATETLRWLCVLLFPVMPSAMKNIYAQIGLTENLAELNPENLSYGDLQAGTKIGETQAVFPRIDKTKVLNEIMENGKTKMETETQNTVENQPTETALAQNPTDVLINNQTVAESSETENFITIDDFLKVELRVGEIKVAERIPKADKLLRFEIDLGEEKPRQILAGLAEFYEPETLIGRKVVVVANLKPRKMRGLESQGMICAASLEDGTGEKPALASFLENVEIGARLK